ncbi:MAG: hypothetical protein ACPG19_03055 [Saprospiraceae bacterium]
MEKEKQVKLRMLEADIKNFGDEFKIAASTIVNENVSNYPIFVAHQYTVTLGIPLLSQEESHSNWSFNATTLEELATKNIIAGDKIDNFRSLYKSKSNEEYVCIFVLEEESAEFVFYPYTKTNTGNRVSDS